MRLLCNHCIGTTLKIRKRKKSQRRSTSEDKMHLQPRQKAHTTNGENASLKQCNLTPDDVIIILPKLSSQKCFSLTTCKIWTQSNVCFLRYENMKNASLMQGHVTCDDVITMTMQLTCRRGLHSCAYQNWTQSELRFRRYMTFKLCALNLWSKAYTFKVHVTWLVLKTFMRYSFIFELLGTFAMKWGQNKNTIPLSFSQ